MDGCKEHFICVATIDSPLEICIMEHFKVPEYSGIFISNPKHPILFWNNYELLKHYASMYTTLGTAGANISIVA